MLNVLITTEIELTLDEIRRFEQLVIEAGATPVAVFAGHPPSVAELFKYHPEVVIAGGSPISLVWVFLLQLRRFRLQGKEWPKIIVEAYPTSGRYIHQIDHYEEKELDYFYDYPPYQELYDIALDHPLDDIGVCFRVLEVEHLVHTTGVRKQWTLTDGSQDYGQLSFKHLERVHLNPPAVVCDFQANSAFTELRPLFDSVISLWPQREDRRKEWEQACTAIRALPLQVIPVGETMQIDEFLSDSNRFSISIEGSEASFRLWPAYLSSSGSKTA